jgi:hypothetical protein
MTAGGGMQKPLKTGAALSETRKCGRTERPAHQRSSDSCKHDDSDACSGPVNACPDGQTEE